MRVLDLGDFVLVLQSGGGAAAPDPPVATAASGVTYAGFTANWNASAGATSYRLDVATDNGFAAMVTGYNDLTVAGTSQAVTGLIGGTTYYYRARAVNASGTSASSNTITQATSAFTPASLSGVVLWWDPFDGTHYTLGTGVDISAIADLSGTSNTWDDGADPTADPTVSATTQNGGKLISMLALNSNAFLPNTPFVIATALAVGGTNSASVFGVVRQDAALLLGGWISGSDTATRIGISTVTVGQNRLGGMNANEASASYVNGQAEVRTVIKTSNTACTAWRNGTQVATVGSGALTSKTLNGIGGSSDGTWNGSFGEVVILNRAVTANERANMHAYLGAKWGITVA